MYGCLRLFSVYFLLFYQTQTSKENSGCIFLPFSFILSNSWVVLCQLRYSGEEDLRNSKREFALKRAKFYLSKKEIKRIESKVEHVNGRLKSEKTEKEMSHMADFQSKLCGELNHKGANKFEGASRGGYTVNENRDLTLTPEDEI